MTSNHRVAILGMRDSGKTTFVGRLWLSVHSQVGKLRMAGLPQELRPLRQVSDFLLRGEYPPHTRMGELASFNVPLRWQNGDTQQSFVLSFTDYAGEELNRIFSKRDLAWTDAWKARAEGAFGLLLFLRPKDIKAPRSPRLLDPPSDEEARRWAAVTGEVSVQSAMPSDPDNDPSRFFDRAYLPEQKESRHPEPGQSVDPPTTVALVEVLQFMRHQRGLAMGEVPDPNTFRVAVVVSCWDVVPEDWKQKGPEPFLHQHFPLVHDFLSTNFLPEGVRIFGLSSTGGDLNEEGFRRQYTASEQEEMGEVVYHPIREGSPRTDSDVTLPIGWLLEGDIALPRL